MSKAGISCLFRLLPLQKRAIMKKLIAAALFILSFGVLVSSPAAATLLVLQVGMEGPPFTLSTPEGQIKKSPELQADKMTVLVFWSSWVPKSEALLARVEKLYEKFKSAGLAVVGINVDAQKISSQGIDAVKQNREKLKLQFPMLLDPGLAAFHDYGVVALPTTVVLDKERIIRYELSGYPLLGADAMGDFITASMTGAQPKLALAKPHYQPNKKAISYYNMGRSTLKSKMLSDKAEPWFKKAVEADPNFVLPHLDLGKIYSGRGDNALAQAEYQAVLAKDPQHPVALCELALLLVDQGKSAEGLAMLETARKSEESYAPCYYYAGYALAREGKDAEASKLFEEAEKLNPFDYQGLAYQGKLYEQKKDLKRAADSYARALEKIVHVN
jgi:tetratricopeptide (TPR) repeat protein